MKQRRRLTLSWLHPIQFHGSNFRWDTVPAESVIALNDYFGATEAQFIWYAERLGEILNREVEQGVGNWFYTKIQSDYHEVASDLYGRTHQLVHSRVH